MLTKDWVHKLRDKYIYIKIFNFVLRIALQNYFI